MYWLSWDLAVPAAVNPGGQLNLDQSNHALQAENMTDHPDDTPVKFKVFFRDFVGHPTSALSYSRSRTCDSNPPPLHLL